MGSGDVSGALLGGATVYRSIFGQSSSRVESHRLVYRAGVTLRTAPRAAYVHAREAWRAVRRLGGTEAARLSSRKGRADLAVFHEFEPPPSGGGHQFLSALIGELRRRGLDVEVNRLSGATPVCLFNSFNFDARRLRRFTHDGCRMVHRVDGPIGVYRGFDDGTDRHVLQLNHDLADATIVQSRFSLDTHRELELDLRDPTVILNAVDPAIFHPPERHETARGRPLRLIATSWSDNPRKGADVLAWLDEHLDWDRFQMTFVGRTPLPLGRITTVGPVGSEEVANLLRAHDLYIAGSLDDPCSNAVLEALACGVPVAYRRSGGHPELVGEGGLPFDECDELPAVLERLSSEIEQRRAAIRVPSLSETADRYLEVLRG